MDNTKSSIKGRFAVVLIVIAAWVYSMFPLQNKDFFEYVKKESAENISSKKVDDETYKKVREQLIEARIQKNKINSRKTREAFNEAYEAWRDTISQDEIDAFSKALELAGISKDSEDIEGGEIVRDEKTGAPNGLLLEAAMYPVLRAIPEWTDEQTQKAKPTPAR